MIKDVGSPYFGLIFDTVNFTRLLDEPVKALEKLGKYVYATHIKDLKFTPNTPADKWFFFSSVPVGDGYINMPKLVKMLEDLNYEGLLAVELDFVHPEVAGQEDIAVEESVKYLQKLITEKLC